MLRPRPDDEDVLFSRRLVEDALAALPVDGNPNVRAFLQFLDEDVLQTCAPEQEPDPEADEPPVEAGPKRQLSCEGLKKTVFDAMIRDRWQNDQAILDLLEAWWTPEPVVHGTKDLPPLLGEKIEAVARAIAALNLAVHAHAGNEKENAILDTIRKYPPGSTVYLEGKGTRAVTCAPCEGKGGVEVRDQRFQCSPCRGAGKTYETVATPEARRIEAIRVTENGKTTVDLFRRPDEPHAWIRGLDEDRPMFLTMEACQLHIDRICETCRKPYADHPNRTQSFGAQKAYVQVCSGAYLIYG